MRHAKLMTHPHRGAQTICNRMMKTGHQFYPAHYVLRYDELLDGRLLVQIERAIYEFFDCFHEVFTGGDRQHRNAGSGLANAAPMLLIDIGSSCGIEVSGASRSGA